MKNIIICFDGTGNDFSSDITNVAKIANLSIYDQEKQVIFYSTGIGTEGFVRKWTKNIIGTTFEKAFGAGLSRILLSAYIFLMREYQSGDRVFLFGFSRGAYTARAFASVLYDIGILYKNNEHLIGYLARLYLDKSLDEKERFKKAMCQQCIPYFLGLFDTVDSRGKINKLLYPLDILLKPNISYSYHALAIDEKRYMFQPELLNQNGLFEHQVIEQVWFVGSHSDIGGGNPNTALSDIPLDWMLRKAIEHGLLTKPIYNKTLKPNILSPIYNSYKGGYKLWKPYIRKIPEGANIHVSVFKRINYNPEYKPLLPLHYDMVIN